MNTQNRTKFFQNCLGVFQGGGCKGIAYVGAYREALKRGVFFSEIVGVSAGSIIAVFIAAGASPDELEEIIYSVDFKKFLMPSKKAEYIKTSSSLKIIEFFLWGKFKAYLRTLNNLGLYSSEEIEKFVDGHLRKILKLDHPVKFRDLLVPCSIVSSDLKSKSTKIWSTYNTPDDEVGFAVRASSSIPIFFQPVSEKYVDGGILSNLPTYLLKNKDSLYDKIIAFSFESSEESEELNSVKNFISALIDTSILGTSEIQLSLMDNINLLKINTGEIKTTDFNIIKPPIIEKLIRSGIESARDFFNNEMSNLKLTKQNNELCRDIWDTYKIIANSCNEKVEDVIISEVDTNFVYDLFPTIIKWKTMNAKISVLLKENTDDLEHGPFRLRFLQNICSEVSIVKNIPFRGYLLNGNDNASSKLISINQDQRPEKGYFAKYYFGDSDFPQINLIFNTIKSHFSSVTNEFDIEFKDLSSTDILFDKLKKVTQYTNSSVTFEIKEVKISELKFLTKYVRGYRYRQINNLFEIYVSKKVPLFMPIELCFQNGKSTIVTPPVVEKHGDLLFVIEGNTRLKYLNSLGIKNAHVIQVNNVTEVLPSNGRYNINQILISDKEKIGLDRYNNFDYNKFRKIEKSVRNPADCLK
ncbi:patatin-like phospholipase family protein [Leptospira licerasiae]|uniref:patatin-like phospholipase family protein n=1 Tax=Leptospira licerasiae TaxID=447106 RepID=UPI00301A790A